MPARTGEQYIQGLRERPPALYMRGEKVEDATTHPGLTGGIGTLARLYDLQHDPVAGDELRVRRTLRRHPEIAAQWNANPRYILDPEKSRLTPHDRELLILRMGWNSQAVYEWAKHVGSVGRARDHGLEPKWIAQGGDASGWNTNELTLIDAANEMYRDSMIADETWDDLSNRYDMHQMISIAATASRYRKVSMTLNAFGVQPLPDDERFPVLEGY